VALPEPPAVEHLSLLDAVDRLLNRGVVLAGEATISLAEVDLIYVGLNLVLASVATLRTADDGPAAAPPVIRMTPPLPDPSPAARPAPAGGCNGGPADARDEAARPAAAPVSAAAPATPGTTWDGVPAPAAIAPAPGERPEQGLDRLVLALVELLRRLLERQALRRMECDDLTDDAVERMGRALMELEAQMARLRAVFGLTEADLNLDLGPVGRLLA
jgi:hypothetical protein